MQRFIAEKKEKAYALCDSVSNQFPHDAVTRASEDPRLNFVTCAGGFISSLLNVNAAITPQEKKVATESIARVLRKTLDSSPKQNKLFAKCHEYKNPHLLRNIADTLFAKLFPYKTCTQTTTCLVNTLIKAGFKNVEFISITPDPESRLFRHFCVFVDRTLDCKLDDVTSYPKDMMVLDIWGKQKYLISDIAGDLKSNFQTKLLIAAGAGVYATLPIKIKIQSLRRLDGLNGEKCNEAIRFLNNIILLIDLDLTEEAGLLTGLIAKTLAGFDGLKPTDLQRLKELAMAELEEYKRLALEFPKTLTLNQHATMFAGSSLEFKFATRNGVDELDRVGDSLTNASAGLSKSMLEEGAAMLARELPRLG